MAGNKLIAMLASLPRQAAWRHVGARDGFEVVFVAETDDGLCFAGTTSAVEEGRAWTVSYQHIGHLDGCLDVDLESSAPTNAFPAPRLGLALGQSANAPAAYVRAEDLRVERLEQSYLRLNNNGSSPRFEYAAPVFDFECELVYDGSGLLLDYPGIAVRTA